MFHILLKSVSVKKFTIYISQRNVESKTLFQFFILEINESKRDQTYISVIYPYILYIRKLS